MKTLSILMHADWSSSPQKRVACFAARQNSGRFRIFAPQLVGELSELLYDIYKKIESNSCALLGFDFPIGLPIKYAEIAGIKDFLSLLPKLGKGNWHEFFNVSKEPEDITTRRPFYPKRPGAARQKHLVNGIGVKEINDLRRICEKRTLTRRAASPLFWTLGPQQVGKAAISGWRDLIAPAIVSKAIKVRIWPFSGELEELLSDDQLIIVETYPAEYYSHFGLAFGKNRRGGKVSPTARAAFAPIITDWIKDFNLEIDTHLSQQIEDGFERDSFGDDAFDAFIGLMGMLSVVFGFRPPGAPDIDIVRNIEGWIFGQSYL